MKKILIFTKYYLPGYKAGGPIRSISNIVKNLNDTYEFYIVTSDRDSHENRPYLGIEQNHWNKFNDAQVLYLSPEKRKISTYLKLMVERKYDVIYLNSFFDIKFSLYALVAAKLTLSGRRIVIAPRGEFSKGALNQKNKKKRFFLQIMGWCRIHQNVIWQASSILEKDDIVRELRISQRQIVIAPNISENNSAIELLPAEFDGVLKIIFLSRIDPKKNLDFALNILKLIGYKIEFNIYGSISDPNYWNECKIIIESLPSNITVKYHGPINHNLVLHKLSENHLFFLPTKGENYGHVIVEALTSGIPVLISDNTPWKDLLQANVGWDISLSNPNLFADVINKYYLALAAGQPLSKNAIMDWISEKTNRNSIIELNKQLFEFRTAEV